MKKYIFRKYKKEFPQLFEQEKRQLTKILGNKVKMEHVGSTAVPKLGGKGIIDVLVGVPDEKLKQHIVSLENERYEFRKKVSTPKRLFFRRDYHYKNSTRRVHIHLTKYGSKDWNEIIAFRDYLRKHPNEARKYADLKQKAVKIAQGEGKVYREFKKEFIKKKTKKALNEKNR